MQELELLRISVSPLILKKVHRIVRTALLYTVHILSRSLSCLESLSPLIQEESASHCLRAGTTHLTLQSHTLLLQEFLRISQPGYHLNRVRDFYILTIDRAHANNIRHAQALNSALVELSHEGAEGSNPVPSGGGGSKLFPAMEERSLSLPNIMPLAAPTPEAPSAAARAPPEPGSGSSGGGGGGSGGGGGGGSSDDNRPRSGLDKFPKEQHVTEEMRSVSA